MENATLNTIFTRRSVRAYQPQQIEEEKLQMLLKAACYAPSGMNRQAWQFVAVQGAERIEEMCRIGGLGGNPFYGAPTVILAFAQNEVIASVESASLALENILLAAHAMELGGCWIHAVKDIFSTPAGKKLAADWGVPADYTIVGSAAVGYPDGPLPEAKSRREGCVIVVR